MGITICQTCFVRPFYCLRPFSGLLMYSASAQQELCTTPFATEPYFCNNAEKKVDDGKDSRDFTRLSHRSIPAK